MTKHLVKTSPHKFFLFDKTQLLVIAVTGLLFGVITILLVGWLGFGSMLVNFRVGLIISGLASLIILLNKRVESALMIVIFTVVVLWNQWLQLPHFWQALAFYAGLSAGLMALFGWISQLKIWQLRLSFGMVVVMLLSII